VIANLLLRQSPCSIVRFALARRAAVQDVRRLQQCAGVIKRTSDRHVVPVFVAAGENNIGACNCALFRQCEVRSELPTMRPREFALIATVIVKGGTPEWFETNVPDHLPLISVAA